MSYERVYTFFAFSCTFSICEACRNYSFFNESIRLGLCIGTENEDNFEKKDNYLTNHE